MYQSKLGVLIEKKTMQINQQFIFTFCVGKNYEFCTKKRLRFLNMKGEVYLNMLTSFKGI